MHRLPFLLLIAITLNSLASRADAEHALRFFGTGTDDVDRVSDGLERWWKRQ